MRQRLAALGLARGGANGDFAALVSGDKRQQSRRRQTTVQRQLGGLLNAATSERLECETGFAFTDK
ncbi:hypothetical protein [Weizmannia agrestimuris]|uniref:hypothetical protein n=1 Tax=Weizmannia agrestimuris TaxID=2941342 RepID=UPI00203F4077|nr:hypothetical protein [Weizmannia agrestimuris]